MLGIKMADIMYDHAVTVDEYNTILKLYEEGEDLYESDVVSEIYAKYKDHLVYCEPYDEEYEKDLVPVGIDISDSLLITKYHLYEGDCALGISAYTSRPEGVETFLEFLFSEAEEVA